MERKTITQREFRPEDHAQAEKIAKRLGYTQFAYTSSSDLIGLFCLRDRVLQKAGCIISTVEFGLMFVQDMEDMNMSDLIMREVEDGAGEDYDEAELHTHDAEDFGRGT